MFRTSPGPSSGGTTVFLRHLALVILKLVDSLKFPLYSSIQVMLYSGINVRSFIFLYVVRDLLSNNNNSIANCIYYLTKKSNSREDGL